MSGEKSMSPPQRGVAGQNHSGVEARGRGQEAERASGQDRGGHEAGKNHDGRTAEAQRRAEARRLCEVIMRAGAAQAARSRFVELAGGWRLYQRLFRGCAHDPRRYRWTVAIKRYGQRWWVYTPWGAFFFER